MLDRLRASGRLEVTALAEEFGLSAETIRRDLIVLEQAGSLKRVHGGALLETSRPVVPDVRQRESLMTIEKKAIAEIAAEFVPVGGLVLIDAGTTTKAFAEVYPLERASTVVTPSLNVATTLLEKSAASVHTLGGDVNPRTWSEAGQWTLQALSRITAEVVFLGCSGISLDQGATTSDGADGDVKRAMLGSARRCVMMADSSKIGTRHLISFAELGQIDILITGRSADPHELERIAASGVDVRLA
ncbi:DeoR family transcriptional regulator [Subtercola lobariae]|uniref:Lactose phosphotransferase system repressor n=2 Tax=Subtercola lobariae TaxID=1588641 RepID=A0A917B243_9MICO|nr:DeoR family transcriptional regulator [Subtercola lobariae]